jgi:hypothetical protein
MILYGSQTMDINSQHHNLLGNQISPKSEDFCILAAIFAVAIETKKGGFKKNWIPIIKLHETL